MDLLKKKKLRTLFTLKSLSLYTRERPCRAPVHLVLGKSKLKFWQKRENFFMSVKKKEFKLNLACGTWSNSSLR